MFWLNAITYIFDVFIIATYFVLGRTGKAKWFHWANATGCFSAIAVEVIVKAYPVMPLTIFFGLGGWYGLWSDRRKKRLEAKVLWYGDLVVDQAPYRVRSGRVIIAPQARTLPQLDPSGYPRGRRA